MAERVIDPKALQEKALQVVARLKEVSENRERTFPAAIEAVLVFSGPGTYYDRLKPGQSEWQRSMDRDRIRAGVAVVREVTSSILSQQDNRTKRRKLTKQNIDEIREEIKNYGPFFVYNGIPVENVVFRQALESSYCVLPKEKVLIIDEVRRRDHVEPIAHTGHQVESFFQELANPHSPLYGIKNVALVAHISDFARNLFYTKKYNDELAASGGRPLNFWVYAIKNRPGTEDKLIPAELERVVTYAGMDHLATDPSPFSI